MNSSKRAIMADIKDFFTGTTVWQMGEHSLFMCNLNFTVVCETISNVLGISFKVSSNFDQGIFYSALSLVHSMSWSVW